MSVPEKLILRLEKQAYTLRKSCLNTVYWAGSGHIGGALSSMDILTALYYHFMKIKPDTPEWPERDRLIISKGHIGIGHAPILADLGYIESELLKTYNHTGSTLGIHLDSTKVPGVDASTGSLGHGLSIAAGTALAARVLNKDYMTFCLLGDGECDEGSVWEAAMSISNFNLTNLVTIVDRNRCMIDGNTEDVMKLEPFIDKWKSFGFDTLEIDGHDFNQIIQAFNYALNQKEKPVAIIANTVKGCGIQSMENDYKWHYGGIDEALYNASLESLKSHYEARIKEVL